MYTSYWKHFLQVMKFITLELAQSVFKWWLPGICFFKCLCLLLFQTEAVDSEKLTWAEDLECNWSASVVRDDLLSLRDFLKQGMQISVMEEVVSSTFVFSIFCDIFSAFCYKCILKYWACFLVFSYPLPYIKGVISCLHRPDWMYL